MSLTCQALPKLIIADSATIDFKIFPSNQEQQVNFVLSNEGDQPLKILRIRKTCGCAVIQSKIDTILPGASAELSIMLIANSLKGAFSKKIFIETNEPKHRFTILTLTGHALPLVAITPKARIYAPRLILNKPTSFSYTLTKSVETINFETPVIQSNYPIEIKFEKKTKLQTMVILTIAPEGSKGKLQAAVTIPLDSNVNNDLKLHLSADVGAALYAIPGRIKIPSITKRFEMSIQIKFAGLDQDKIDPAKISWLPSDGIQLKTLGQVGDILNMHLSLSPEAIKRFTDRDQQVTINYPDAEPALCTLRIQ